MGRSGLRLGCAQQAVLVVLLVVVGGVACTRYLSRPPERSFVEEHFTFGRNLIAYEVLAGEPQVAFRRNGRVTFDHLKLDWISIEWPPTPAWQLTGNFIGINATDEPANIGLGTCWPGDGLVDASDAENAWPSGRSPCDGPAVVFGQINDSRIVALDVSVGLDSQRFSVAAPGYIVRTDRLAGPPQRLHFLDAAGLVIWETELP